MNATMTAYAHCFVNFHGFLDLDVICLTRIEKATQKVRLEYASQNLNQRPSSDLLYKEIYVKGVIILLQKNPHQEFRFDDLPPLAFSSMCQEGIGSHAKHPNE
jgi:hypothetical protein